MKHSPLNEWHVLAQAKMADFGGWEMPIEYAKFSVNGVGGGVIAEHTAVREVAGIFDVSHLGKIWVRGGGALDFVNSVLTNDLNKIGDSSAQYNLICNDAGGVIDDLIVYRRSESDLFLVPNAANCSDVFDVLVKSAPAGITVTNEHENYGVLALQGPKSAEVLRALGLTLNFDYMQFSELEIPGHEELGRVIICRTGYTGEFGYELIPTWEQSLALWQLLLTQIQLVGGRVCGLGARDTLRTEMGYPLHGHELSLAISPLEASAGWAVALNKSGGFHGQAALMAQKAAGLSRVLRALKISGRGIPRAGMQVLDVDGQVVGEVTSGTFSPSLKTGIALALINPKVALDTKVSIDVRGNLAEATVVKAPLVASHVR
jgi:aminomethyltransferase